jgi:hypothetical protein
MSTQNELWFKEPVTIFLTNGEEVDGVNICFVRNLEENEVIDELDLIQELDDFFDGACVGTLYKTIECPDGSIAYVEVDEYDDYGSSCAFQFVNDPFEDVVVM